MIPHGWANKRETRAKPSCALLQLLLKRSLRWMAGGWMLREKRISAVKQSSSWMGFFFKAVPPTSSQVFISCLTGGFSRMITSFTCREKTLQIETLTDFRQQGLRWRCRVFVYFPALFFCCHSHWGLRALMKAYLRLYIYSKRHEDVESQNVICLFCSGIVWQMEAMTQAIAAKVTERCRTLSWGMPELLLYVHRNLPFHLCAPCVIYFLPVSLVLAALHFYVYSFVVPLFKRCTWPVQSAHTNTVIGLNKKPQNRLQTVPSGPLLLLPFLCLIEHWIPVRQSQYIPFDIHERKASQPGRRIQNAYLQQSLLAYAFLIYFSAILSLGGVCCLRQSTCPERRHMHPAVKICVTHHPLLMGILVCWKKHFLV